MADLLDGIARYLHGRGLLTYDPAGLAGDTFVETMPPAPDQAVALALYDGAPPQARDDADTPACKCASAAPPTPASPAPAVRLCTARCTASPASSCPTALT